MFLEILCAPSEPGANKLERFFIFIYSTSNIVRYKYVNSIKSNTFM